MRFPFTKPKADNTVVVNNLVNEALAIAGDRPAAHQIELLTHEVKILTAQLEDAQAKEPLVMVSTEAEEKLQAVYRFLSGEDIEMEAKLIKQLGNRLGLSSPNVESIYARCDALQGLAVTLDQIRNRLTDIDIEDIEFTYSEDADTLREATELATRR